MLIQKCVCDQVVDDSFKSFEKNGISCLTCPKCGIVHQKVDLTEKQYYDFYTDYHMDYQKTLGQVNYQDRYEHDCKIARLRLAKYKPYLRGHRLLDIGSSNGAFVNEARAIGWDAWGVEPNREICNPENTYHGTLVEQNFYDGEFSVATLHDVLEHVIDPITDLKEIYRILSHKGLMILDMPDYFAPSGKHHWRHIEHLWIFAQNQLCDLLNTLGWGIVTVDKPIPSKYVIYAEKI